MFVGDIRNEFYEKIVGKQILLLVSVDTDAICACHILKWLLRSDNVIHTLIPVFSLSHMKKSYQEYAETAKHVILINCGANIDIVDYLDPPEETVFYIVDIHRPSHVCNVYSDGQVCLLMSPTEDENIPDCHDIFRDDEESEESGSEEEDENSEGTRKKKRRFDEEALEKRAERRTWEEKRKQILFNYTQYTFYGQSSAMLLFDLAWKLSKDTSELLWWSCIGLTSQLILGHISTPRYVLWAGQLQRHAIRLGHAQSASTSNDRGIEGLHVSFDKDLQLALYRHWSVESSLRHSPVSATQLRLWSASVKGERKLLHFIAQLGLPLSVCRQKYSLLSSTFRSELLQSIETHAKRFNMEDLVFGSFSANFGFRNKFSASDVVYATFALMDFSKEKEAASCFDNAMDCLCKSQVNILRKGIDQAKQMLTSCSKHIHSLISTSQMHCAGPFLYGVLPDAVSDSFFFGQPFGLAFLARLSLHAYAAASRNRSATHLPLILTGPSHIEPSLNLVVGIPPLVEEQDSPRNLFEKAFQQAGERTGAKINQDFFDTAVLELAKEDRVKFFDCLIAILS